MAYSDDERGDVKLAYLKIITGLDLIPDKLEWVVAYFETYLQLNPQEEAVFRRRLLEELGQQEVEKVMRALSSYRLEGMEEGKRLGWEEGQRAGKEEVANNLLVLKTVRIQDIVQVTGLSYEEVELLAQKH